MSEEREREGEEVESVEVDDGESAEVRIDVDGREAITIYADPGRAVFTFVGIEEKQDGEDETTIANTAEITGGIPLRVGPDDRFDALSVTVENEGDGALGLDFYATRE